MTKEKTVKRVVAHPKLYMRVDGKLQHVLPGTEVTVTEAQSEQLGSKLDDPSKRMRLDTTAEGGKAVESDATELEAAKAETQKAQDALVKTAAELEAAKAETQKAQDALVKTATELDTVKKQLAALKAKK